MNDARRHAVIASQLLDNLDGTAEKLRELTPEQRLEMAVTGQVSRLNADLQWTATLAIAHGLASMALAGTEEFP